MTLHLERVGERGSAACPSNVTVCLSDDSADHLCIARRTSRKVMAESGNFRGVLNPPCPIAHFNAAMGSVWHHFLEMRSL